MKHKGRRKLCSYCQFIAQYFLVPNTIISFPQNFLCFAKLLAIATINANSCSVSLRKLFTSTKINYLDQTVVFVFIQVFPCALLPVPVRHQTRGQSPTLPFLPARTLNTSFSLCSLQSWRSHGSSHSRGSLISVTAISSIPPVYPWGTGLAMCTGLTGAAEGRWLKIKRQFGLVVRYGEHVKWITANIQ